MSTRTLFYGFCISVVCLAAYRRVRMRARLPPGPPGRWLIGNLRDIPHDTPQWLTFKHWGEKFGEIVYLEVFTKRMVISESSQSILVSLVLAGHTEFICCGGRALGQTICQLFRSPSCVYSNPPHSNASFIVSNAYV
jgi:hypothetical protein